MLYQKTDMWNGLVIYCNRFCRIWQSSKKSWHKKDISKERIDIDTEFLKKMH